MTIQVPKGKYVVAVSGGVDSVALLNMLVGLPGLDLVVANFDHGIRDDSALDAQFVKALAEKHGLSFVLGSAELGLGASEEVARLARYEFLRTAMQAHQAQAIITAHHQDDLLETIVMHMLRGTGRRGLDPMRAHAEIVRPLIGVPKAEIISYARAHNLQWREDSTNTDMKYRRNHVRHNIMPKLAGGRAELITIHVKTKQLNDEIDSLLAGMDSYMLDPGGSLVRSRFVWLPYKVAAEYVFRWLSQNDVKNLNATVVASATVAAKTLGPGKKINIGAGHWLISAATSLKIVPK